MEISPVALDLLSDLVDHKHLLGLFCITEEIARSKVCVTAIEKLSTYFRITSRRYAAFGDVFLTVDCLFHPSHVPYNCL